MKIPATIKPESITAIIDTREQEPLTLEPLRTEAGTLATGDYSVRGLEHVVAIERKSLPDLIGCVGRERERFDREVQRLLAYPVRVLLIEATWQDIEAGDWRSQVTPEAAMGSLLGWVAAGLAGGTGGRPSPSRTLCKPHPLHRGPPPMARASDACRRHGSMSTKPASYVVTLRPDRAMTDDQATRCLRAFLKAALRSYGLRAVAVDRADGQQTECVTEATRGP